MKKKVIHYLPNLINGGIEAMLLNYYEHMNGEFQFDIVVHKEPMQNCQKKFEKLGSKVYKITSWMENPIKNGWELYKILKKEKPDIFHTHHNLNNFIPCFVAFVAGVKVRISHNHLYVKKKNLKQKFYSFLSNLFATDNAACGIGAAITLRGEKAYQKGNVKIIHNAIDISKFLYHEEVRNKIRKQYHLENNIVYGNVGRFTKQKNQLFLLDIYKEISMQDEMARFFIIGGDGPDYETITKKIVELNLQEKIILLKDITNVFEYYQAMDLFLLPSLYEGLAVSVIEAQISGLSCVVSDTVTKEFSSDTIYYVPSIDNVSLWVNKIMEIKPYKRKKKIEKVLLNQYDINVAYKDLEDFYNKLIERR